jgi:hypothetical protein
MKVEENNRFVTTVGNFETVEFAVQRHNMRHLMSILRDQLYSDKKLAPIREYSCNAYDANVENGKKDVPIKVTLPTTLFPEWKVRDYGKGVSYEDMKNIFCSYGESTKRNSNDFIGQLGIGSKSGFAYGDNFLVTSYMDGKKITYNCVLDKSGVGALLHLTTEDSNEPSGLEITIPVKNQDLVDFKLKSLNFFKYWNVYPEVVGISSEEIKQYKHIDEPMLNGAGWELYAAASNNPAAAFVVMGNISYPMTWDLVYDYNSRYNDAKFVPFYNFLKSSRVVLRMDIGSIEMAPSREALQYTEKTIASIRGKVDLIIKSMRDSIQQKIATANNLWEAKYIYGKIFGHIYDESGTSYTNQAYCQLEKCFSNSLTWNNIIISSNKFENLHVYDADLGKVTNHRVVNQAFSYFQISQKGIMKHSQNSYSANSLQCNPKYKIVINDIVNKKTINKSAIRYYLDNNKDVKILYYLNFNTEIAKSTWFKDLQFETVPLTLMSDLVNEYVKNKPKIVRSKVPKELTKIGYVNIPTFYRSGNFTQYETIDLNAVNGVYVYSEDRVVDINGRKINLVYFLEDLKNLNSIFNMGLDKVYLMGPRIKDGKKFNNRNWINIETLINKSANANNSIANYIEHTAYNNSVNNTRRNSNTKALILSKSMMQSIALKIKNPNGTFNKIFASYPDIDFKQDGRGIRSMQNIGLFDQNQYNTQSNNTLTKYTDMWTNLYNSYRMLKYINIDFSQPDGKLENPLATEIADYINMVDSV